MNMEIATHHSRIETKIVYGRTLAYYTKVDAHKLMKNEGLPTANFRTEKHIK